jgi:tetratricopeptide (TPR) repeat protein
MRANALMRLGRNKEARATLDTALAEDPDSPHSHASQGWVALDARKYDTALFHFSEALRRDPNHEWARSGLVEAMKAKNVLYRPLLAYFLFMSKLTEKQRWLVILAIWFGPRILRSIGKSYPPFYPVAVVVGFACLALVLVSWLGGPLSNFLLALNKFGRAALLPIERNVAYLVGGCVIAALSCLAGAYFAPATLPFAAAFFIVGFAATGIEQCEPGFPRRAAIGLAGLIGLAALLGAALTLTATRASLGTSILGISFLGAMIATWIVNGLMTMKPKK